MLLYLHFWEVSCICWAPAETLSSHIILGDVWKIKPWSIHRRSFKWIADISLERVFFFSWASSSAQTETAHPNKLRMPIKPCGALITSCFLWCFRAADETFPPVAIVSNAIGEQSNNMQRVLKDCRHEGWQHMSQKSAQSCNLLTVHPKWKLVYLFQPAGLQVSHFPVIKCLLLLFHY